MVATQFVQSDTSRFLKTKGRDSRTCGVLIIVGSFFKNLTPRAFPAMDGLASLVALADARGPRLQGMFRARDGDHSVHAIMDTMLQLCQDPDTCDVVVADFLALVTRHWLPVPAYAAELRPKRIQGVHYFSVER